MTTAGVRTCGAIIVAVVLLLVPARPAVAHPSDFDTLTLDMLIGPDGLAAIDAAVVQGSGPGYEPFPSATLKRDVADQVLSMLQIPTGGVEIDARASPRYHEVGFHISVADPSLGQTAALTVDTRDLLELARSHDMEQLKISVCGVADDGEQSDRQVLTDLDIRADRPGHAPTGQERPNCRIWPVHHRDAALSLVVAPQQLADTGQATSHTVGLAALLMLLGGAMRTVRQSEP